MTLLIRTLVLALLVGTLSGCTASHAAESRSTESAAPTPSVASLTQSGTLAAPEGTKSAAIAVTCTGKGLAMTVGNEDEPRSFECQTSRTVSVPVNAQLVLKFEPWSATTTFVAKVSFSRAAFVSDKALASQCTDATTAFSSLASAANGLLQGAITQDQAETLMAQAASTLTETSTTGTAGQELAALRTWLLANPTGDPRAVPMPPTINQLCTDNESPLLVMSQYGG